MIWININLEALPQDQAAQIIDPINPEKVLALAYKRHTDGKYTFVYGGKRYSFNYDMDTKFVHYSDILVCKYNRGKLVNTMSLNHFKKHYLHETLHNEL